MNAKELEMDMIKSRLDDLDLYYESGRHGEWTDNALQEYRKLQSELERLDKEKDKPNEEISVKELIIKSGDLNDYTIETLFEDLDDVVADKVGKKVSSYAMELVVKVSDIIIDNTPVN